VANEGTEVVEAFSEEEQKKKGRSQQPAAACEVVSCNLATFKSSR
jgi:hypothetical protein